jgi:hypothetical protein
MQQQQRKELSKNFVLQTLERGFVDRLWGSITVCFQDGKPKYIKKEETITEENQAMR